MKKVNLERELENKLKEVSWTYSFNMENKSITFHNMKIEDSEEKKFLDDLKKEDSEKIIESNSDISYLISRSNGTLWISLLDKNRNVQTEERKINEKDVLEVFRESKKEPRTLSDVFNIFPKEQNYHKKEFIPNSLKIKYESINNIEVGNIKNRKFVSIYCGIYHFRLREDGGLKVNFNSQ